MPDPFPSIRFTGTLRPTQRRAAAIAADQLEQGERRLHIVAPPGSGKTIMGLYLWAHKVRTPVLVLSPNTAIQTQWIQRLDLFDVGHAPADLVSTDPQSPSLLTSLTYQSITLPKRADDTLNRVAEELWVRKLIQEGEAEDEQQAIAWIAGLQQHNQDHYNARLAVYRGEARDGLATSDALSVLHRSARDALMRLRDQGVGMIIADECHHLLGHWGRVLHDAQELLGNPIILGLTATPPERRGRDSTDLDRYDRFFGEIDFEVPTPALVREGFLSPFQDLAYFVRPTSQEMHYLGRTDARFRRLVEQLCRDSVHPSTDRTPSLPQWVQQVLKDRRLPTGLAETWTSFARRDPAMALAGPRFLIGRNMDLPTGVPNPPHDPDADPLNTLMPVLDRYIRHGLLRSPATDDHELARKLIRSLRLLGLQVTETGTRPCASPVSRVLAYSHAKAKALIHILKTESETLGDRTRAVIVTDHEKTSATATVAGVLDPTAGGAVAAFRTLLSDPVTDALDPVLITGSTVLVDDDLMDRFLIEANRYLADRSIEAKLRADPFDGYYQLIGRGAGWGPRHYVGMITDLFQRGVTRCLVGTRGLLGEGWDAHTINVLVDLTTVTSSMSVNQLRGRSIRIDPNDPAKVANNWDVVCVAGEFARGLADYERFMDKHRTLYGVCDDGAIEKGVGHVHPAFTELEPEGIGASTGPLNEQMLGRARQRVEAREAWRIGDPFDGEARSALEVSGGGGGGFPPFSGQTDPWTNDSMSLAIGRAVLEALVETHQIQPKRQFHGESRSGGYVRMFLGGADEPETVLFADSLAEVLGPLERPRYVIPRFVDHLTETWLSHLLPEILARYVRRRDRKQVMLHAVPSALSAKRELADVFAAAWNRHVSPGEVAYAHRGDGEQMLEAALREGLGPTARLHQKQVFA
jgi:hypothetical protein